MTTIPISPDIWDTAQRVCTERQLVVLELRERHGYSWNMIAIYLNITNRGARDHYAAATRNVYNALERTNGNEATL